MRGGDTQAMDRLFPLVYEELRRLAHAQLRRERPGHTLGTTGLVHETYVRLVDQTRVEWRDRGHFLVVAAWAMRRILVDYARRNRAARRGGGSVRFTLDADVPAAERERDAARARRGAGASRRAGPAAQPGGGVPLLRRAHRAGDRRRAGGDPPDGPARLGQGAGLAHLEMNR